MVDRCARQSAIAWYGRLAAKKHDTSKRRKPGRPPIARSITRLVLRLGEGEPTWGYRRIHGGLTKPGLALAPSTVYEILRAAGIDPAPRRSGPPGGISCTPRPLWDTTAISEASAVLDAAVGRPPTS